MGLQYDICITALNTLHAVIIIAKQIQENNFYVDNSQPKVRSLVTNKSMNLQDNKYHGA